MSLATEDLLRLNVLLANNIEAIRIDEQTMTVHGLAGEQEAAVHLNPNCRADQYLRRVREVLSSHVLGSPGGYPVFLQRWTRMGQARQSQLEKLLLLGEPEAVIAVAGSPDLSDDIARRVWWTMPTSDIARRMLEREAVVRGEMGPVLAAHLVEHLPFEDDPLAVITTVRLVLQPGLIDAGTRQRIWSGGTHRNAYHIGFLEAVPDDLPDPVPARPDLEQWRPVLAALAAEGNAMAGFLARLLDVPGQTFLAVSQELLENPVNHDSAAALLNAIGRYFRPVHGQAPALRDVQAIVAACGKLDHPDATGLVAACPGLEAEAIATLTLAQASEALIVEILAKTSASGTLLRRKLDPVIQPLLAQYAALRGGAYAPARRRGRF
ncbi:sulfur oxidation protein DsrS [Sulfurifustis variabilis]|uniref:Sulfur oxidation protein DsrS n=1 Tax=Sulfurifustis variabilis TaxID=1675686 RepID=A0A1B4V7G1_9GAMM|nr:sulfur reduction protein DsrS [Sulfurifustis variabilis]BAU49469.1 sulfur oxidation protein DsrS [Sulfurifustis variabilis]